MGIFAVAAQFLKALNCKIDQKLERIFKFSCVTHKQTIDSYNYCKFIDYDIAQSYNQNNHENWYTNKSMGGV